MNERITTYREYWVYHIGQHSKSGNRVPNIVVGTVGGGTELPSQRACLDVLGLSGPGSARALAEICAGLCLAGELSLSAAICAGNFTRAHRVLGRVRARRETPLRSARFAGQPRAIRMEEGN